MITKRGNLPSAFLLAAFAIVLAPLQAFQLQTLTTQVSASAEAQLIGPLPGTEHLSLALTLRLRNQQELHTLLQRLYDPASPDYRQFLTVEQFTERFGPTIDDYQKVIDFAQSNGLTVTRTTPNRLVLDVGGTVASIDQAFHLTMQVYQHPTEPRTFYAPTVEPSMDPSIPVQGVSGLNTMSPPRPMDIRVRSGETASGNLTGSGIGGEFLGSDIRAAYFPGVDLDGAGQMVGLVEFLPYNFSDVQAYFITIGQPLNVPIFNVFLDGVTGLCGAGCDDGEPTVDIVQAISMAPNLSAVIAYEGTHSVDITNQMATDNVAKQLSTSYGWLPADPSSEEPIFMEFAAQGQSFFTASLDNGAFTPPAKTPPGCTSTCNPAWYPSDDPYVTAVGGTDLTASGPGGSWQSETAWVNSGGGFSTNGFLIPAYQVPVIDSMNQGSTTLRNVPDIAAEANVDNYYCASGKCNGESVIGGTSLSLIGGTSLASPRWAAALALANQQADGTSVGFLNPPIYGIAKGANYTNDFHDITVGNNFTSLSPSLFSAAEGYDLVTGLGSPNGQSLLTALGPAPTGPNFAIAPSSGVLKVTQGSSVSTTVTVSAVNGFAGTVDLNVAVPGQPAGLTASLSPTTITGTGSSTLKLSTSSSFWSPNLPIIITGASGGINHSALVTLVLPNASPTVTVTPSSSSISTAQTLSVTVAVSGGSGNPIPTGSVTLMSVGFISAAAAISGGNATISVAAGSMAVGTHTLVASYTPDAASSSTYTRVSGSASVAVTQAKTTPTVTVTPSASSITTAQALTVTVAVNGGSGSPTPTGSVTLTSGTYTSVATTLTSGSASINIHAGSLATGTDTLTASYTPDTTSSPTYNSASGSHSVTVTAPSKTTPTVTVTPSASSITSAQALTVTVAVNGGSGSPTPTGSVTLTSGTYTSVATTLTSGSASINIPAGSLATGTDTLTASYTPDTTSSPTYNSASGSHSVTVTAPSKTTPTVTVTPSASSITTAQALTVTIAVSGGGGNPMPTGSVTLTSGNYSSGATALSGGAATITIAAGSLATGTDTLTASYSGDTKYSATTGTASVTVTTAVSASFTVSGTAVTVIPGATAANTSTVSVTPAGGFSGNVALTATVTSSPTGALDAPTLSFGSTSPVSITGIAPETATLTISTTAATKAVLVHPKRNGIPWYAAGGATLACILLFGIPARRRSWRAMLGLLVFLIAISGGVLACGGGGSGSGGGGGGTGNPGTTAGTYTVTITGTSGTTTATGGVTLTVQ